MDSRACSRASHRRHGAACFWARLEGEPKKSWIWSYRARDIYQTSLKGFSMCCLGPSVELWDLIACQESGLRQGFEEHSNSGATKGHKRLLAAVKCYLGVIWATVNVVDSRAVEGGHVGFYVEVLLWNLQDYKSLQIQSGRISRIGRSSHEPWLQDSSEEHYLGVTWDLFWATRLCRTSCDHGSHIDRAAFETERPLVTSRYIFKQAAPFVENNPGPTC